MRVGLVILPTDRWREARRQWEWADGAGFATAWTYDHIRWGGMPDGPWHAAVPVLAAAAVVTERVSAGHARRDAELPPPGDARPRGASRSTTSAAAASTSGSDREARAPTPRHSDRSRGHRPNAWLASRSSSRCSSPIVDGEPDDADVDAHGALRRGRGAEHAGQRCSDPLPLDDRRRRGQGPRAGRALRPAVGDDRADRARAAHARGHPRGGSPAGPAPRGRRAATVGRTRRRRQGAAVDADRARASTRPTSSTSWPHPTPSSASTSSCSTTRTRPVPTAATSRPSSEIAARHAPEVRRRAQRVSRGPSAASAPSELRPRRPPRARPAPR